jgi:EAL domain-containing protein (putative c-di-GMP-specific phosphodiesterase class I)
MEETGLILPLGRWVLETACQQARAWQLAYPPDPPLMISVNLSARQFGQTDLVDQVATILGETGLRPECLELEIDRSFVAGLAGEDANLPIVRAVIALAHGLGIDVTAEGIETAD